MTMTSEHEFENWLENEEDFDLEFKSASNQFDKTKDLPNYCAAFGNEGGGKLILGVTNEKRVIGTKAFIGSYNQLPNYLSQRLSPAIRVDVEELQYNGKRILIFHIPSRPLGEPIKANGKFWMRAGESLKEMDNATLRRILNETQKDFSTEIVPGLGLSDLDNDAIIILRKKWSEKAKRDDYLKFDTEKLLKSLGLLTEKGLNYASLILLGKKEVLDELLSSSEIIFEWRQDPAKTAHDFRINWREPFMKIYDEIWKTINARNLRMPFQEGFIQREVWAFDEKSIREAVLNAVAHRDYSIQSRSIFIKASPDSFFIESPGGLLPGVTLENILETSAWRNRRIAEIFEKTGLVERSGQGMNDIFRITVSDGKGLPNLAKTDSHTVRLEIPAKVKDKDFILYLEQITNEKQISLSEEEIYALEDLRENQQLTNKKLKDEFLKLGLIEKVGNKKGTKYILSKKYYEHIGDRGAHTKLKGISREQKKMLILNHLKQFGKSRSIDFQHALDLDQIYVRNLMTELKTEGKVERIGNKVSGYWILNNNLKNDKTI